MFEEQIARGAALLDKKIPGWELKIDVGQLDMSHSCRCIVGQALDDYWAGLRILGIASNPGSGSDYGFLIPGYIDAGARRLAIGYSDRYYHLHSLAYKRLEYEWTLEIKRRLDMGIVI